VEVKRKGDPRQLMQVIVDGHDEDIVPAESEKVHQVLAGAEQHEIECADPRELRLVHLLEESVDADESRLAW
jgi:hypothetical protein